MAAIPRQGHACLSHRTPRLFQHLQRTCRHLRDAYQEGRESWPNIPAGRQRRQLWSKFWITENLEVLHGERIKYEHNYPTYFPQAASNPQHPYCYPDDALGEFANGCVRFIWPKRMPGYLLDK
jgi:hypothetical protein